MTNNDGKVFSGFLVGLMLGSLLRFFKPPRIRLSLKRREENDSTDENLNSPKSLNPVHESVLAGKAAARRRRAELGLYPH